MQRYKLVLGGTIAGIAGVLAFPTRSSHLTVPAAAPAGTGSSAAGNSGSTSAGNTGSSAAGNSGSTSGSAGGSGTPAASPATRSATSADETFRFGDMAVKVTVTGSRITDVSMATLNETDNRSYAIDHYAVPQLEQQVIAAGSVNINGVSGATFTSQTFVNAVANALNKLGIRA